MLSLYQRQDLQPKRIIFAKTIWLFVLNFFFLTFCVNSHELRPSIVDITSNDGIISVSIETNLESFLAGIAGDHDDTEDSPQAGIYNNLRKLEPNEIKELFSDRVGDFQKGLNLSIGGERINLEFENIQVPDQPDARFARDSIVNFQGEHKGSLDQATWQSAANFPETIIRVRSSDGSIVYTEFLTGNSQSKDFALQGVAAEQSGLSVFLNYVVVGFEHIIPLGLDHIIFVVGLFLFSNRLKPLLLQVSAFTLAHTITLALGALGIISIIPWVVETIIALSIVYVGLENIVLRDFRRHRILLVFAFGLLHGLGFSGVLGEFGLPETAFVPALIGFNIGVEFGQLAVIAICLIVTFAIRNQTWYRTAVTVPVSLAIAIIGAYWVLERTEILTSIKLLVT